jgi:hypothetical protein
MLSEYVIASEMARRLDIYSVHFKLSKCYVHHVFGAGVLRGGNGP